MGVPQQQMRTAVRNERRQRGKDTDDTGEMPQGAAVACTAVVGGQAGAITNDRSVERRLRRHLHRDDPGKQQLQRDQRTQGQCPKPPHQ